MDMVLAIINKYQMYIIIGLVALVVLLMIMVIICLASLNKVEKRYRKLTRGTNNKNLEEILVSYLDKIDEIKGTTDDVKKLCNEAKEATANCIQRVSMVRYRAFDDVGSDLSYSIAMLDGNNNGIVITSIYGRNESTTYAKPIDKGISRYDLSEEEEKVLHQAVNSK